MTTTGPETGVSATTSGKFSPSVAASPPLSPAGIVGIALGSFVLVISLVGLGIWVLRSRRCLGKRHDRGDVEMGEKERKSGSSTDEVEKIEVRDGGERRLGALQRMGSLGFDPRGFGVGREQRNSDEILPAGGKRSGGVYVRAQTPTLMPKARRDVAVAAADKIVSTGETVTTIAAADEKEVESTTPPSPPMRQQTPPQQGPGRLIELCRGGDYSSYSPSPLPILLTSGRPLSIDWPLTNTTAGEEGEKTPHVAADEVEPTTPTKQPPQGQYGRLVELCQGGDYSSYSLAPLPAPRTPDRPSSTNWPLNNNNNGTIEDAGEITKTIHEVESTPTKRGQEQQQGYSQEIGHGDHEDPPSSLNALTVWTPIRPPSDNWPFTIGNTFEEEIPPPPPPKDDWIPPPPAWEDWVPPPPPWEDLIPPPPPEEEYIALMALLARGSPHLQRQQDHSQGGQAGKGRGDRHLSPTRIAAPGYTSRHYTPSKRHLSPPQPNYNGDDSDINDTSNTHPQDWSSSGPLPRPASPTPISPLQQLFHPHNGDDDDESDYHPSPPPTLPNTARPLSLVQEYSLAQFPPASPCPPPQTPSPTTTTAAGRGPSITSPWNKRDPREKSGNDEEVETYGVSDEDEEGGVSLLEETMEPETPSTPPTHQRSCGDIVVLWEEQSMESLFLTASRRDSARERERDALEASEESGGRRRSSASSGGVVGGFPALKGKRKTSFQQNQKVDGEKKKIEEETEAEHDGDGDGDGGKDGSINEKMHDDGSAPGAAGSALFANGDDDDEDEEDEERRRPALHRPVPGCDGQ